MGAFTVHVQHVEEAANDSEPVSLRERRLL